MSLARRKLKSRLRLLPKRWAMAPVDAWASRATSARVRRAGPTLPTAVATAAKIRSSSMVRGRPATVDPPAKLMNERSDINTGRGTGQYEGVKEASENGRSGGPVEGARLGPPLERPRRSRAWARARTMIYHMLIMPRGSTMATASLLLPIVTAMTRSPTLNAESEPVEGRDTM